MVYGLDRYVTPGWAGDDETRRPVLGGTQTAWPRWLPREVARAIAAECPIPRESEPGVGNAFNWDAALDNNWRRIVAVQKAAGKWKPPPPSSDDVAKTLAAEAVTAMSSAAAARRRAETTPEPEKSAHQKRLDVVGDQPRRATLQIATGRGPIETASDRV